MRSPRASPGRNAGKRRSTRRRRGPWPKTALVRAGVRKKHGYFNARFQAPPRPARRPEGNLRRRRLTTVYHMLSDGTAYADLGADHVGKSDPITRMRALARQVGRLGFTCSLEPAAPVSI